MPKPAPPRSPRALFPLVASVALCGAATSTASENPASADPARTDADFAFQGEYAGEIAHAGQAWPIGVQVLALGEGTFAVVAYPGGLPGDDWAPPAEKIKGTGRRIGEAADAVVSLQAIDLGGTPRRGTIRGNDLIVLSESGVELARLPKVTRTSPTLGDKPPPGAILIYDGTDGNTDVSRLSEGRVAEDGSLMEGATTRESFGDAIWHVEFRLPYQPKDREQERGNSGVYLQGRYEIQVLDSFGLDGRNNDCGGIYSVAAPAINMCLPPLAWQTYDIDFTAPRFEGEKQVSSSRMTVRHNGVVIHDDVAVPKATPGGKPGATPGTGPLHLQNHGNPVRYRNIWVLPKS